MDFTVSNWWNGCQNARLKFCLFMESTNTYFCFWISIKFSAIECNTQHRICLAIILLLIPLFVYLLFIIIITLYILRNITLYSFLSFCHQLVVIRFYETTAWMNLNWKPIQRPNQKEGIKKKAINIHVLYYIMITFCSCSNHPIQ